MKYPVLKIKQYDLSVNQPADALDVVFNNPHLVVSLILPELSKELNDYINQKNLKPYELACAKFSGADYEYSKLYIDDAGKRVFSGLSTLFVGFDKPTLTMIVSYLEFTNDSL